MTDLVPLESVLVVDRHRRDLGDLAALAESIKSLGLIQAIAITPDGRLIAGHRRLEAFRLLGRDQIPARVIANLTDARSLLEAERDENTCRREMTPSEKASLGMALEELERPKAAERQATIGVAAMNRRDCEEKISSQSPLAGVAEELEARGKVNDIVGAAIGMSGVTYSRAKHVVAAATDDSLPEEVRNIARTALREMDTTNKVSPAYEKVIEAKKGVGLLKPNGRLPQPQRPPAPPKYGVRRKHLQILDAVVNGLAGTVLILEEIEHLDTSVTAEEATRLTGDLSKQITALRRINSLIKERTA